MFIILDYSSALEYSIIRRYTNIVNYYYSTTTAWVLSPSSGLMVDSESSDGSISGAADVMLVLNDK